MDECITSKKGGGRSRSEPRKRWMTGEEDEGKTCGWRGRVKIQWKEGRANKIYHGKWIKKIE